MKPYLVCCLLAAAACDLSVGGNSPPFDQLTTGANHTCGRSLTRQVYCWGADSSGQLGLGVPSTTPHPAPSAVPNAPDLFLVVSSNHHSCGVGTFNRLFCWGANASGQLGTGDSADRATPTQVAAPAVVFVTVGTGAQHTCALSPDSQATQAPAARAICWGDNTYGQLGDSSNSPQPLPVFVASDSTRFISISVGANHTCALDPDGNAWCWGDNTYGQLGDGTTTTTNAPVAAATGLQFARISAGGAHTCGITGTAFAFCWGRAEEGQLGVTGTFDTCNAVACRLAAAQVSTVIRFGTVTSGAQHTCGITVNAQAMCWGQNARGQVGVTTGGSTSPTPVVVSGGRQFVSIIAGGSHTCAFTPDADPFCWGANGAGQLGDGSTTDRFSPVLVRRP